MRKSENQNNNSIHESINEKAPRRDFLKTLGFTFASAAIMTACKRPMKKAIPYFIQSEGVTPGESTYYATSCIVNEKFCSVLGKVRDGRPIKIEGNKKSPFSRGGTTAQVQASLLELYNPDRYKSSCTKNRNQSINPELIIEDLVKKIETSREKNKEVALITPSILSPVVRDNINIYLNKQKHVQWVELDESDFSPILDAHKDCFNIRAIPNYHFEKARAIVGIEADFLGSYLAPDRFASLYSSNVKDDGDKGLKHIQFESGFTVTGGMADIRYAIEANSIGDVLLNIYSDIADQVGEEPLVRPINRINTQKCSELLWENRSQSIVITGSLNYFDQVICVGINYLLGNYGQTLDMNHHMTIKRGDTQKLEMIREKIANGEIDTVALWNVNPVYSLPKGNLWAKIIENIENSYGFYSCPNETSVLCQNIVALHTAWEDWQDLEPIKGFIGISQPLITPLYKTISYVESILSIVSNDKLSAYTVIKDYWSKHWGSVDNENSFEIGWQKWIQKGYGNINTEKIGEPSLNFDVFKKAVNKVFAKESIDAPKLAYYENVGIGLGTMAHNPWLQELPDPVTKNCWGNYFLVSQYLADKYSLNTGSFLSINGVELPVIIQEGQAKNTINVAIGYGHWIGNRVSKSCGKRIIQLFDSNDGDICNVLETLEIHGASRDSKYDLALAQTHNYMEDREVVKYTRLSDLRNNPNEKMSFPRQWKSLYNEPKYSGHHWGLAVDLNKCTGCSNCVVSCQVENNISVVGKDQVQKRRIMHWIRLDRYYKKENDNTRMLVQPVMCQHCDNAPCENVCPVAATMHSAEGLNQMAYNRCVGTRYCLNNCPYRVRRFNWYNYIQDKKYSYVSGDKLRRMVLNPDVAIRSRGVIEKCSFCVQRIQEKKLEAKLKGRPLMDQDIQPACVQSCPSKALVFGDLEDKNSRVINLFKNTRNYFLLEELHTLPSVGYLSKVIQDI